MAMSSSSTQLQSIKQEVVDLVDVVAATQTRLQQLVARLDEDNDSNVWRDRCKELEKSHKEAINSAKWLRAQNADLEQRLDHHRPELDNALIAREAAFRKLKHARKVIRDLMDERGDMSSPREGSITQEEIEEALYDDLHRPKSESSSSSSSPDSDRTVRLAPASVTDFDTPLSALNMVIPLSPEPAQSSQRYSAFGSFGAPSSISSQSLQQFSPQRQSPKSSPETLSIHFTKPPGSSLVHEGPLSWDMLERSLHLTEDNMNSIRNLADSPELSMRLQIIRLPKINQTVAFLYDPIFVENRAQMKSFNLDWGRQEANENAERYISGHKGKDLVFHTFVFPATESSWFYVGALSWSVVDLPLSPLDGRSKEKLIKKLCARTRNKVDKTEIGRLLESGSLKRICVELARVPDAAKLSSDFAQKMLGRTPFPDPKHERRAERMKE